MPVAIPRKLWKEDFAPGLQALETGVTLIEKAGSIESAHRVLDWLMCNGQGYAEGDERCLDVEGDCTRWPTYPLELCCSEALKEYAEAEHNPANQRNLGKLIDELEELESSADELSPWRVREMSLAKYKLEAVRILSANISILKRVYAVGRPANSKLPR